MKIGNLKKRGPENAFQRAMPPRLPKLRPVGLRGDSPTLLDVRRVSELVNQDSKVHVKEVAGFSRKFFLKTRPSIKVELFEEINRVVAQSWGVHPERGRTFTREMIPRGKTEPLPLKPWAEIRPRPPKAKKRADSGKPIVVKGGPKKPRV